VLATEWNVGSVLLSMIYFFFIFMLIWMFIAVFADIFRRNDLSGGAKALWILFIFVLPLMRDLFVRLRMLPLLEDVGEVLVSRAPRCSGLDQVPDYCG